MPKNFPWTSVAVLGFLVTAVTILSITRANSEVTTTLLALIPGLLAAGFSERNSRDIRNGVVAAKAKEGAVAALNETGVTAVASLAPDSTRAAMLALTKLLENNTEVTNTNTNAVQTNTDAQQGGKPNG